MATLEQFTRALSMVFAKVPLGADAPEGAYTVDHSASLAVLDPQGRLAGVISGSALGADAPQTEAIAADLLRLSASPAP